MLGFTNYELETRNLYGGVTTTMPVAHDKVCALTMHLFGQITFKREFVTEGEEQPLFLSSFVNRTRLIMIT